MTRGDGERNEGMYERCGMGSNTNGVNCEVEASMKRNTLTWFTHREDDE